MKTLAWDQIELAYQRYNLSRLCNQAMRQLLVVLDQVADVDVAVEFLQKRIFA